MNSNSPTAENVPNRKNRVAKLRGRRFLAWCVGLVYFISGTLKLIDPTGAGLVMEEYFKFLHLDFLLPAAKGFGTAAAFLEVILGTALLTGVWRKITAICITVLHSCFTLVTAALLIWNPVMDCGCFGEAIHLSHEETFFKNIILLAMIMGAYLPYKRFGTTKKRKYVSFGLISLMMLFFMVWSLTHLPAIDFTVFKPSTTILAGNKHIDADELYESIFIYSKDGKSEEFDLEHLPDSTWTFENTVTRIRKQDNAPILSFFDDYGFYRDTLAARGQVAVMSIYRPDLKERRWKEIERTIHMTAEAGFTPLLLLSTERRESTMPEAMRERLGHCTFHSDFKTLITFNRSNGGLTYLNDGYIVCKSTSLDYPTLKKMQDTRKDNPQLQMLEYSSGGNFLFQALMFLCLLLIIFI